MKMMAIVNYYSQGRQTGIQAAHAVVRRGLYNDCEYQAWATVHETLVVLDGGDHKNMKDILYKLEEFGVNIGIFQEAGQNNCLTGLAVILTAQMINAQAAVKEVKKLPKRDRQEAAERCQQVHGKKIYGIAEYLLSFRTHSG